MCIVDLAGLGIANQLRALERKAILGLQQPYRQTLNSRMFFS
jgi:hypothetical protein